MLNGVLEARKKVLGEEHLDTLTSMEDLAWAYLTLPGKLIDAKGLFEKTVEARKRISGDKDQSTLYSMAGLAGVYRRQGRLTEASELYES